MTEQKKKTLLDLATVAQTRRGPTTVVSDEMIELYWAYMKGRITMAQAAKAMGTNNSKVYSVFFDVMRKLVADGDLEPSAMLKDIERNW